MTASPVLLLAGAIACPPPAGPLRYDDRMSAWLEFVTAADLPARMDFAAAHHLDVRVALIQGEHDRDFLAAACAEADAREVSLTLWPLLPEHLGYWPNQSNAEPFAAWVDTLVAWAGEDCPRLDALAVDMEMPLDRSEALFEMSAEDASVLDIADFFLGDIDEAAFDDARAVYADLADRAHQGGLRVGADHPAHARR